MLMLIAMKILDWMVPILKQALKICADHIW